jgi:type II secretory pathway pseudopilin PulG
MRRRQAFTIIELLVSFALVLFIMVVLTEAFSSGMETFRQLKAVGDLQEKLRTASTILRRDLTNEHFEAHRRLSDPNFWNDGYPALGYFCISAFDNTQGLPTTSTDGIDSSLSVTGYVTAPVICPNANNGNQTQVLSFTVKLRANQRENFFSAAVPNNFPLLNDYNTLSGTAVPYDGRFQEQGGTSYNSQWAEIAYFLVPNGSSAGTGTRLYSLYRSQLVVAADTSAITNVVPGPRTNYAQMSYGAQSTDQSVVFNTPSDLTGAANRIFRVRGAPNQNSALDQWGAALLLGDVISFDVRPLFYDTTRQNQPLASYFQDATAFGSNTGFDTAAATGANIQNKPFVKALQISIRIWDLKTQQTRQVTIVQDM